MITSPDTFFLPYQRRWIEDTSRFKIMEKSRQVGISWATAYSLVRRQSSTHTNLDAWVSSRDEIQAKLFLEDCRLFAETLQLASCDLGEATLSDSQKPTAYSLTLANGRRIHSLSSSPDAQAGKRGSRVLDEFALQPDPRQLYAIASPGLTWGGSMEIISTHRGSNNFFWELIQEARHGGNPKKISLHRVTLEDALNEGFLERLQSKLPADDPRQWMDRATYFDSIRASCPDNAIFRQEYMCEPADDAAAFLSYDLVNSCEYPEGQLWEIALHRPKLGAHYVLGVDVGRDHDLTVMWLLEVCEGVMFTRHITCLQNTPFVDQAQVLAQYLNMPNLRRVAIDQTGIGRQLAEDAIRLYGAYRVEGVTFTGPVKEALAYPVRSAFESRSLRIPACAQLRADLTSVKKEVTAAGHLRFSAERSNAGHADHFWALALALYAADNPTHESAYEPLSRSNPRKQQFSIRY